MNLTPNIGPQTRVAYVVFGVVLIGLAWVAPFLSSRLAVIVGALGALIIVEGAIGF